MLSGLRSVGMVAIGSPAAGARPSPTGHSIVAGGIYPGQGGATVPKGDSAAEPVS
ncbi:hypothetical protein Vse01_46240 [Micromonospora sediminimaris]|uniref:Uncharacterized protein n=1 Tax=Micromonospora sediminimaris TaxID=547162 RepID=A0A9W5UUV1_9ACTN|nr:hypothetical protein Vse01_46240 [Micromonospora sediminimaris]